MRIRRKNYLLGYLLITIVLLGNSYREFQFNEKQFSRLKKTALVENEIVVQLKPNIPLMKFSDVAKKTGLKLKKTLKFSPYGLFDCQGKDLKQVLKAIRKIPFVAAADQNSLIFKAMIPNDPYYSFQWHFNRINMPAAWDDSSTRQGQGIVVAILDTGVAYEDYDVYQKAPDLVNTFFLPGYDFVNGDTHPNDDEGHGTHMCGTIAQSTNNNYGVAGVAFKATIMPIKVLAQDGSGTADWFIDGLYFAADNGADVINMSLSWPEGYDPGETVYNAIKYAVSKGAILVGASGNDGYHQVSYPAAYPEVIAVGAINSADERPSYSNYGSAMEVCAPGGDKVDRNGDGYMDGILQQTFDGTPTNFSFWFYSGTSSAAAHVSGVVALLFAKGAKGLTEVRNILRETSLDLGDAGWDQYYGYGLIDAETALERVSPWSTKRLSWTSGNSLKPQIAIVGSYIHVVWQEEIDGNYEIFYKRSTDNGENWTTKRLTYSLGNSLSPQIAVADKFVHVVWQEEVSGNYEIFYKKSSNYGVNWSNTRRLTWTGNSSWHPSISVSGTSVHVAWSESINNLNKEIYYKRSLDNGNAWGYTRRLVWLTGNSEKPSLAVSGSNIFLVWEDNAPGNKEIYFKRSLDNGVNWSAARRLTWSDRDSQNPYVSVYSSNIHLVWEEKFSEDSEIYYKRSLDNGNTWTTERLTWSNFDSSLPSLRVSGNIIYLVWEDASYSNRKIFSKRSQDNGSSWLMTERATWTLGGSCKPGLAISGSKIHLVWEDNTPGNKEIYYKIIR